MTPMQLNKTAYIEIFRSNKGSIKKSINYINYSKLNHDVITNKALSSAHESYRKCILKYEQDQIPMMFRTKGKFLNRSIPFSHHDRRHIIANIRNVKNVSDLNKLKTLQNTIGNKNDSSIEVGRNYNTFRHGGAKGGSNYIFFKRKTKSNASRPFNENDYQTSNQKRPHTQKRNFINNIEMIKDRVKMKQRLENASTRSVQRDYIDELTDIDKFSHASRRKELTSSADGRSRVKHTQSFTTTNQELDKNKTPIDVKAHDEYSSVEPKRYQNKSTINFKPKKNAFENAESEESVTFDRIKK